jgi:pyridoxal phosphate enzyme (YggS family)
MSKPDALTNTPLPERLAAVRESIRSAATRVQRNPADVELVAISKTHPPETLLEATQAGQLLFGESRIQEARAKIPALPSRIRWHFVGHLQRNKVRHAVELGFELLHGIDTLELARELNRIAADAGAHPRILLEVNVAGEATKFGFSPARLPSQMEELLAMPRLQIEGLMTIAPLAPSGEASRRYFVALRKLRNELQSRFGVPLQHLSMGMSADFPVAVEEGATLVRVGTAIFGPRKSGRA